MIVTTTPGIEGREIGEWLGLVASRGVLGVNAFKDVAAGVRNVFGGRSKSYENELASGVSDALKEMERRWSSSARTRWWVSTSITRRSAPTCS